MYDRQCKDEEWIQTQPSTIDISINHCRKHRSVINNNNNTNTIASYQSIFRFSVHTQSIHMHMYSPTEQARPIRHRLDHHRALRQSPHHWTPTFHRQNNQTMMRGLPPMQPKDLPPEQEEPSRTKAAGPVPPRRAARSVSGRLVGTTSMGGTSSSRSIVSRIADWAG